ncbi:MAG TPA: plastocyanin/azurin family copper-binding protein [Solirubrobacter sp.]
MHVHPLRAAAATLVVALSIAAAPALGEGGTIKGKVDATPPKYLEDTVVYLKEVPGTYPKKTHAYDQKGMRFIPHVMTVTVGDTVDFLNGDNLVHNVYSSDNEGYNLGSFKQGEKRTYTFEKQGVYGQLCSIHPEMQGYIFVGQNPYASAVDKQGAFEIKNVPAGSYKLAVWNSHLKAADKPVTVAAGKVVEESFSLKR